MSSASALAARAARLPVLRLPLVEFELRCGARLLVSPREGAPVTAMQVHLRGGPSLDPEGLEGTAYLTGGLVDQGTAEHDEAALAALLEPAGGEVSGDANGLHAAIAGGEWKLLLDTLAEMTTRPTFPSPQVARQRGRLLHRLAVERDDPRLQAGIRFRRLVYGDHWLGRPAYGTLETVARIRARHLRAHHARHWLARRALLAVSGDVDPEEVRRRADRCFADWKPGRVLKRRPPALPEKAVRVASFPAERQQVHLYFGHLGIRRRDPDYAALVVLDHVLGTGPGFTNRISRRLRDELGLAYTVSASISSSAGVLPGIFSAYIGTSPEKVTVALEGFLREIRRVQEELVPEQELEVARSYLVGSFSLGFERATRRAGYLVSAKVFGLPEDNLERLPREFAAVTPEDLRRVARKHLFPDRCCLSAAGPVGQKALERAYAAARRAGLGARGR